MNLWLMWYCLIDMKVEFGIFILGLWLVYYQYIIGILSVLTWYIIGMCWIYIYGIYEYMCNLNK